MAGTLLFFWYDQISGFRAPKYISTHSPLTLPLAEIMHSCSLHRLSCYGSVMRFISECIFHIVEQFALFFETRMHVFVCTHMHTRSDLSVSVCVHDNKTPSCLQWSRCGKLKPNVLPVEFGPPNVSHWLCGSADLFPSRTMRWIFVDICPFDYISI